ncbi:MAG: DedA family protein [Thermodesulfobacteriota bacterium]
MAMEQYIHQYGYLAVFVGTFLEGDLVLLLGAYLACAGYFDLPMVMTVAFVGTLLGDQAFFFLGRTRGLNYLLRKRSWRRKADRVNGWLSKNRYPMILGLRFIYGFRSVVSFVFGHSNVSVGSFMFLHSISVFVWVVVTGVGGYYFGKAIHTLAKDTNYLQMISIGILLAALLFWRFVWRNRMAIFGFFRRTVLQKFLKTGLKYNRE